MANLRRVVVLSLDAVRFDALDAHRAGEFRRRHGLGAPVMPHLDGFLSRGTRFLTACTTAPYTTAAHASLFTGCTPPRHGVRAFFRNALDPERQTLAERFKRQGFDTWFLSDRIELFEPLGLTRGFDRRFESDGALLCALQEPERPVLAFVHLFDAHKPYLASGGCDDEGGEGDCRRHILDRAGSLGLEVQSDGTTTDLFWSFQRSLLDRPEGLAELVRMYWAGLARLDSRRLRRYLELLGDPRVLSDSLVIVVSDHGEDVVPGQLFDHGGDLTEGKMRVVLGVVGPGWAPGTQGDNLSSLIDVLPTCTAEAIEGTPREQVDGRHLRDRLSGAEPLRSAYAETWSYQTDEDPHRPERGPLAGHNWMLSQRALRTPERMWSLRGLDLRGDDERLLVADDREFIRLLYRGLLGRYEDAHGSAAHLGALRGGRRTRRGIFRRLRWSRELWDRPQLVRFELAQDPLTEHPIPARCGRWAEALRVRRELRAIESTARLLPELDMTSAEESLVTERLQALGYLD